MGTRIAQRGPSAAPQAQAHDSGRFEWVERERIASPPEGVVQVLRDRWWAVDGRGRVCLYRWGFHDREISPQCNRDRGVAETLMPPGALKVVKIPVAFVPHRCTP